MDRGAALDGAKAGRAWSRTLLASLIVAIGSLGMVSDAFAQRSAQERGRQGGQMSAGAGVLAFEPSSLEFGYVTPGERYSKTVTVTNPGRSPVTVQRIRSSCECTTGSLASMTIPAGGSTELTVELEAPYAMIEKKTRLMLQTSAGRQVVEYNIRSYPTLGLVTEPMLIAGSRDGTQPMRGDLVVRSADGAPFEVIGVGGQRVEPTGKPASQQTVPYDLTGPRKAHWLLVETTHPACPIIAVPVMDGPLRQEQLQMARSRSLVLADRREITLGHLRKGERVEVLVPMTRPTSRASLLVTASIADPRLSAEVLGWENLEAAGNGRSVSVDARIRITATGEPGGAFLVPITFFAESDAKPVTMFVAARIAEGANDNAGGGILLRPSGD